ncbi:hypothetical protein J6590_077843 [Homalodisca vitripennis]|nr:hypothetical protein J6590_077843 [Homalodisca vitripennis]
MSSWWKLCRKRLEIVLPDCYALLKISLPRHGTFSLAQQSCEPYADVQRITQKTVVAIEVQLSEQRRELAEAPDRNKRLGSEIGLTGYGSVGLQPPGGAALGCHPVDLILRTSRVAIRLQQLV